MRQPRDTGTAAPGEANAARVLSGAGDRVCWLATLRHMARKKSLGAFGALVIAVLLFIAIFAEVLATTLPVRPL